MDDCKICTLYSGSSGNCVYIKCGGTEILIDTGKNARTLCRSLQEIGTSIDNISAIFITHGHSDHIKALSVIGNYGIPVHMSYGMSDRIFTAFNIKIGEKLRERAVLHDQEYAVQAGEINLRSFPTPHDCEGSVGFTVEFNHGRLVRKIGIATDIGHISGRVREALVGCEYVLIECNHDLNTLQAGSYPQFLKKRILSRKGHLSNSACAEFLPELVGSGTHHIMLMHLSRENNTPELAYAEVCGSIGESLIEYGGHVTLKIADSVNPVVLV